MLLFDDDKHALDVHKNCKHCLYLYRARCLRNMQPPDGGECAHYAPPSWIESARDDKEEGA